MKSTPGWANSRHKAMIVASMSPHIATSLKNIPQWSLPLSTQILKPYPLHHLKPNCNNGTSSFFGSFARMIYFPPDLQPNGESNWPQLHGKHYD